MSTGEGVRRWPLHPEPRAGEALTSWLRRVARCYGMTSCTQLVRTVDPGAVGADLDRNLSDGLAQMLAVRGAVSFDRVREMSLSGWVPWLFDSVAPAGCDFDTYVHQLSILVSPDLSGDDRARRAPTEPGWLPWVTTGSSTARACPVCISTGDAEAVSVRLMWRLALVSSCPEHQCRLEPCHVLPGEVVLWDSVVDNGQDVIPIAVSDTVTALDCRTTEALVRGSVGLPQARVHAGLWFRMLRTLIDEICIPLGIAGQCAGDLRLIWGGVGNRPARALTRPFERLDRAEQDRILAGAAAAVALLENGTITGSGTHCDLLSPYPDDPVFAGRPVTPPAPARAEHVDDSGGGTWERMPGLIDAVIAAAREDAGAARNLYAFTLFGANTDQQIRRIDDMFAELGIDLDNR